MMKSFILAAALATAAIGTAQAQGYTILGTAPASENGKTVYMTDYGQNNAPIDSAVIREGKFTFKRNDRGIRRLEFERYYTNIIAEPGTITVDMSDPKLVGGTPLNDSLAAMTERQQTLYTAQDEIWRDSTLTRAEKMAWANALGTAYINRAVVSYRVNKDNFFGIIALWDISLNMEPEQYLALYREGGDAVRGFGPLKNIKKFKETLLATAPGKMFLDFEGTDSTDRAVKLSDYVGKGKYVLVDFWALWCGPCRQETPVVAKAYEKYKDKGLEVLGLFVWDKPKNLTKAVKDLKITWPQIIDSKDVVRDLYGVQGIPHIILFGPDGTIVARDLRGDGIETEIARHIH